MAGPKVIFVAFAIEDERMRDFLRGQALNSRSPFEFTDMSVKERYESGWKDKVRTRIKRSDGVIALISRNSLSSTGQQWEVNCAAEENRPLLGIWVYQGDQSRPGFMTGKTIISWNQGAIASFIDSV